MFDKNMEFINNEALKERLSGMKLEESRWDISYCMTPTNDYLLMKNDVPIDDINDPRGAIKDMLKKTIKSPMGEKDIIITFGIGLGYLLDEVFNTYPSRIFVYEPDIKLLHFVLNNVDISEHLSSGRVFITNDLNELLEKLSEIYITQDKVEVVYLKNYAIVKSQELLELTQKVYETCKSKTVDVNTIARFSKKWLENTIKNISTINAGNFYKLSDLEGRFAGQTALILAAGPSLAENIEKIKANREKYVIFAVNKVLRTVISNGIIPDFVVGLDAENLSVTMGGLEEFMSKMCYITDLRADNYGLTCGFKKTLISFASNDIEIKKIADYNNFMKLYECGGSSTTMAFISAVKMGFEKIVFSGLDLAFKDNVMYANGENINRVAEEKIAINDVEKTLTKVKSVTGAEVLTRDDYAAFIKHFEILIKDSKYTEIYNTTSFGAYIEGMRNVPFDNISLLNTSNTTAIILGELSPFKFETKEWSQEELFLINSVIANLSKGVFSQALVSSILNAPILYQYMQADILKVLQPTISEELVSDFISKTKVAVKGVIDLLQKNKLI